MPDDFLQSNYRAIKQALEDAGLRLKNEGFGRNPKATTDYVQYVIYLSDEHIGGNEAALQTIIEEACPKLKYIAHHPITYRKQGNVVCELWVFVKEA